MRVLVLAKEGAQTDAAAPPTPEAMAEYQKFNEELVKAGVVLGAGRLSPSSQGKRVRFDGKKRTVIDGPWAETKELVAKCWNTARPESRRAVTQSSYLVAVRTDVRLRVRTRKTAIFLSRRADSNCRPAVYETAALPAELRRRVFPNDFGTS